MNENKKVSWLYVAMTVLISGIAVVFRDILTKQYVDPTNGLYERGVSTPEAFYLFVAVAVLFILTCTFVMRIDALPKELKHGSLITAVASVIMAVVFIFSAVFFLKGAKGSFAAGSTEKTVNDLRTICAFLSFPAAVYYYFIAFSGKKKNVLSAWFSFLPLIWALVYLMSVYFDQSTLINTPDRIIHQTALIFLMLYQLFETRCHIGKSKPIIYFIVLNLALLFMSIAYIPEVLNVLNGGVRLNSVTVYSVLGGGMVIYLLARDIDFAIGCDFDRKKITFSKNDLKNGLFNDDEEETADDASKKITDRFTEKIKKRAAEKANEDAVEEKTEDVGISDAPEELLELEETDEEESEEKERSGE